MSNNISLEIFGKASGKVLFKNQISQKKLTKTVLIFLKELSFPIASSCSGEGVCEKCIINENILSCGLTLGEFINLRGPRIEIEYL